MDAEVDNNNYVSGSILEHCIVEHANGGNKEGAVVCEQASPFIKYCEIGNNSASGIRLKDNFSMVIRNCNIKDNFSTSNGGGIWTTGNGSLTIISSDIMNNRSRARYSGYDGGGGIYFDSGALTITSSTIKNN